MQFIVEYKANSEAGNTLAKPELRVIEAETPALAQREVEKVLLSGHTDEAVIYMPHIKLQAQRTVNATPINRAVAPSTDAGAN